MKNQTLKEFYYKYGYTGDVTEALDALGYVPSDFEADPRLVHGLECACREIPRRAA